MPQNNSNGNKSATSKTKRTKWTIMVYLAGDGNLSAHCISVLQELAAVDYKNRVRALACFDSNTPAAKGSRYLEISRKRHSATNQFDWKLHNVLIPPEDRGHAIETPDFCGPKFEGQSGSAITRAAAAEGVKRFINWAVENYESEKYMLIFVGHGPLVASNTFLAKENPPSFLRLADLSNVLSEQFGPRHNRKLSILACNNCVMNGIETAVEVKDLCDYMIGSQGMMLAAGWPYKEMIRVVVDHSEEKPEVIAREMLKVCARNLIDFALMDRSSDQALCDLTKLKENDNVLTAILDLVAVLTDGLALERDKALRYPAICDAVKLARLEAQSYWNETFVDLYDFCERLLKKCDDMAVAHSGVLTELGFVNKCRPEDFRNTGLVGKLKDVVASCLGVLKAIKQMVPESYYIGPELQYSHGLSIYFPWTRPERPYFFTRIGEGDNEFRLRTPFQTYREYKFDRSSGWTTFLESFFKATLRRVRRAEREFSLIDDAKHPDSGLVSQNVFPTPQFLAISLQKSSSDTGRDDGETSLTIKNYPRRNYLSPADCGRRIDKPGPVLPGEETRFKDPQSPPVSYLGWNITGLVAEAIELRNGSGKAVKRKPHQKASKRIQQATGKRKVGS